MKKIFRKSAYISSIRTYRLMITTMIVFFTISLGSNVIAANESSPEIPIFIEEQEVTEGVLPQLREDRLFGPVRNISETLGAKVSYDSETNEVSIERSGVTVVLTTGSDKARIYEEEEEEDEDEDEAIIEQFDAPMFIENGRSFVPLRFLAENFGYRVHYNAEDSTVHLTLPEEEKKQKPPKSKVSVNLNDKDILLNFKEANKQADSSRNWSYQVDFSENEKQFTLTIENSRVDDFHRSFDDYLLKTLTAETIMSDQEQDVNNEQNDKKDTEQNSHKESEQKHYQTEVTVTLDYTVPNIEHELKQEDNMLDLRIPRLFETVTEEKQLSPGLNYTAIRRGLKAGPATISELSLDPSADFELELALANNRFTGLARLDKMAENRDALAAINGGFFWHEGHPIGLFIKDQQLLRESDTARSAFIYTSDGTSDIENIDFGGGRIYLEEHNTVLPINSINRPRESGEAIIYTSEFRNSTSNNPLAEILGHREMAVQDGEVVSIQPSGSEIPQNGYVLSMHHEYVTDFKEEIDKLSETAELDLYWHFQEQDMSEIEFALGGGPRIVADNYVDIKSVQEDISQSVASGRHPRTAIGVSSEGDVLLTTVDGRSDNSIGMNLEELGKLIKSRGAVDALNLDGGGSSMMWFDGRYQNNPSDTSRSISNAILITE